MAFAAPTARAPASRSSSRERKADRTRRLARAWPSAVAGATLVAVLLYLSFRAGGYFPTATTAAGGACGLVLAGLLAARRPGFTLSREATIALGALGALALWTGFSVAWSPAPDAGTEAFQRMLLYVALFALALLTASSGRYSRTLLWVVLGVSVVVAGAALLSRLAPDLVRTSPDAGSAYRLAFPLTYWNALGAVSAMGAILALGLAANPRGGPLGRALAAGAAVLLVTAIYLTFSRASWLALIVGAITLAALGAHRGSLLVTVLVVVGGGGLAVLRLRGYPALVDDPKAGAGQAAEGARFAVQLAVVVVAAAATVYALARVRGSVAAQDAARRYGRAATVLATVSVLAVLAGGYALQAGSVESATTSGVDDGRSFVQRQWDIFMSPTSFAGTGSERLTTAQGTRSEIYRVALDGWRSAPLIGNGAGSFETTWYRDRRIDEDLRNAHSLDLEILTELGLVGALLLAIVLATFGRAVIRTRVRGGAVARSEAAAAGAACSVWFVHSFVDWDWQMPAVSGLTLVLAAAVLPDGRRASAAGQRAGTTARPRSSVPTAS